MRKDVQKHILSFLNKLKQKQYEDLEVDLMHFHEIISLREYNILRSRLVDKMIYSKIAKREKVSSSRIRQITHKAVCDLIQNTNLDHDKTYQELRHLI